MVNNQRSLIEVIIWCALFISNFILIALTFILPSAPASDNAEVVRIMFFSGLVALAMSFIVPKLLKNADPMHAQIIGMALNEQVSVLALIISITFGDNQMAYILFGLSIVGFIFKFPKKNNGESASKLDA